MGGPALWAEPPCGRPGRERGATRPSHRTGYFQGPEAVFVVVEGCFPNTAPETKLRGLIQGSGPGSGQRAQDSGNCQCLWVGVSPG